MLSVPKLGFDSEPHSALVPGLLKSHSTTKFPLLSVHGRVALLTDVWTGLLARARSVVYEATYLPRLTLSPVFPLPKRSYAAPRRGARSLKHGTHSTAAKSRLGTKRPAAR